MNGSTRYLATNLGMTLAHQGRTGKWLAGRLGLSEATISRVISRERTIDGGLAERVAFVTDVPLALLFEPVSGRVDGIESEVFALTD